MRISRLRPFFSAAIAGALALSLASCASTTVPQHSSTPTPTASTAPVTADDLAQGFQDKALDVDVPGPVEVTFREITLKPGAGTGRHCHDGYLIAVVKKGALTHYAPIYPTGVHIYKAGDSLVEGPGYVHEGKNEGTKNVVLWVTYIIPKGKPLAETDLSRCDPVK